MAFNILPRNSSLDEAMPLPKPEKEVEVSEKEFHKIRISLTGKDVPKLERVCRDLKDRAESKNLFVKGPVRLPTRILKVTPRKSPSGQGTHTFDHYEMRIHKRLIDLIAPTKFAKKLAVNIENGIEVDVMMMS
ncbi:40S ribosomal protein S20 [Cladophialophora chaetospira]|uniref:Small ribosomal subunit protein uS10 n=1 Tax=Cladophialophora chaetospira TaxID=386627 RepID=A0AA39CBX1_9EURO|nr:40S ribosomal protein S20 [Cladophialophora chaetospira]